MPTIEINVNDAQLQAMVRSAVKLLGPESVNRRVADSAAILTRNHLRDVSAARDSGSRFYEGFSKSTFAESDATKATVQIAPVFNKASSVQRGNPLAAHYWGYQFT